MRTKADKPSELNIQTDEEAKIPVRAMRDRLFKMSKDITKFNRELESFLQTLSERTAPDSDQDTEIMKAAMVEMEKAAKQLEAAHKWISFINDYGPISDS